jgi:hypothetical protein
MSVSYQLPSLGPGIRESQAIDNVVKTALQEREEIVSGNAFFPEGVVEIDLKLFFLDAINSLDLLFFP